MKKIPLILFVTLLFLLSPWCNAKKTTTQYPVVLVHGLMGFDNLLGIDYFYNIATILEKDGTLVFTPAVSAINSSEVRGEQLLTQIESILALTSAKKVNLIGHSQGAQTARYVASIRPDLIASVTSVGGANYGSGIIDFINKELTPGSQAEYTTRLVFDAFGGVISLLSGNSQLPQNTLGAINSLSTQGAATFNQKYPEGLPKNECEQGNMLASNGVYYFSWSGTETLTNILDLSDLSMLFGSLFILGHSDGLISRCSSHLGHVIKDDYKMNHLDEINQFIGLHSFREVDPVELYRSHVTRLQKLGL